MRILFDNQAFDMQQFGGVSRYYAELIDALRQFKLATAMTSSILTENRHLIEKRFTTVLPVPRRLNWRYKSYYIKRINGLITRKALALELADVLHMTFYDLTLLEHVKCPFVLDVHDMIPELFPQYFRDATTIHPGKRELCQRAHAVICNSQQTKSDLVQIFDVDSDKISVIHRGISSGWSDHGQPVTDLPDEYVLFVGKRAGYKNFGQLANAIGRLRKKHSDLQLVCVGGGRLTQAEHDSLDEAGLAGRVRQLDATDRQLSYCYAKALAFVFPSIYEGFGFPVLESFSSGCPAILSNRSSFPEIAADAALYFNPDQPESLDDAIDRVLCDRTARVSLINRGRARVAEFTWEKTAVRSLAVYRSLMTDSRTPA
jgi:glycosyltransferase involved in cell wall biosynthesis